MLLRVFDERLQCREQIRGAAVEQALQDAQRAVVVLDDVEIEVDRAPGVGARHVHDAERGAVHADPPSAAFARLRRPGRGWAIEAVAGRCSSRRLAATRHRVRRRSPGARPSPPRHAAPPLPGQARARAGERGRRRSAAPSSPGPRCAGPRPARSADRLLFLDRARAGPAIGFGAGLDGSGSASSRSRDASDPEMPFSATRSARRLACRKGAAAWRARARRSAIDVPRGSPDRSPRDPRPRAGPADRTIPVGPGRAPRDGRAARPRARPWRRSTRSWVRVTPSNQAASSGIATDDVGQGSGRLAAIARAAARDGGLATLRLT